MPPNLVRTSECRPKRETYDARRMIGARIEPSCAQCSEEILKGRQAALAVAYWSLARNSAAKGPRLHSGTCWRRAELAAKGQLSLACRNAQNLNEGNDCGELQPSSMSAVNLHFAQSSLPVSLDAQPLRAFGIDGGDGPATLRIALIFRNNRPALVNHDDRTLQVGVRLPKYPPHPRGRRLGCLIRVVVSSLKRNAFLVKLRQYFQL